MPGLLVLTAILSAIVIPGDAMYSDIFAKNEGPICTADTSDAPGAVANRQTIYNPGFDFVPGETVLYYESFEGESIGELPTGWNTTGTGAVVTLQQYPGNWIKLSQDATFITDNKASFGNDFTIEFDLLLDFHPEGAFFPVFTTGFLSSGAFAANDNAILQDIYANALAGVDLNLQPEDGSSVRFASYKLGNDYLVNSYKPYGAMDTLARKVMHVSMQAQKERLRIWVNQDKIYDLPRAIPAGSNFNQLFFSVTSSSYDNDKAGVYITNIKVAKGLPDTRHQLIDNGVFSTTGILFDVNKATVRPESYGVLKEIAGILQQHPAVQILVVGHTDADGPETTNQALSEKRAAAVKMFLQTQFGIEHSRMTTTGKGESKPVADNNTAEGKARNRRVEFIKQ